MMEFLIIQIIALILMFNAAQFSQHHNATPKLERILRGGENIGWKPIPNKFGTLFYLPGFDTVYVFDLKANSVRSFPVIGHVPDHPHRILSSSDAILSSDDGTLFCINHLVITNNGGRHSGKVEISRIDLLSGARKILDTLIIDHSEFAVDDKHQRIIEIDMHQRFCRIFDANTGSVLKIAGHLDFIEKPGNGYGGGLLVPGCFPIEQEIRQSKDGRYFAITEYDSLIVFDAVKMKVALEADFTNGIIAVDWLINSRDHLLIPCTNDSVYDYNLATRQHTRIYAPGIPSSARFTDENTLVGAERGWGRETYPRPGDTLGIYGLKDHTFSFLAQMPDQARVSAIAGSTIILNEYKPPFEYIDLRSGEHKALGKPVWKR
jgi:hypothetical protein